ncbi:MAG: VWA domain-containing protein [Myxococcaceae bacterium]|nr:VWA domain-containing protein [Myxococcaceae bacterium]
MGAVTTFALTQGCVGCLGFRSPVDQPGSNVPGSCNVSEPQVEAQKLDILFVIDNSNSMFEEQAGVAQELTAFIDEVRKGGGVSQDFNVGVITTSVYQYSLVNGVRFLKDYPTQEGRLQPVPDAAPDGGVLLGTGTERMINGDDPLLIDKFSRLVRQGTRGSGQETPFEAVRLALLSDLATTPMDQGGNQGFLRDGARLLIVVLTDEDDCSQTVRPPTVSVSDNSAVDDCGMQSNALTPVSEYHRMFTEDLKDSNGQHKDVVWTAIGPVGRSTKQVMSILDGNQVRNIDCPTSNEPGFRQRAMAEAFDTSLANLDSICRTSYRDTLVQIAALANVSQTLDVSNIPDPALVQIAITRHNGDVQKCSLSQGLTQYDPPNGDLPGRFHFGPDCKRRADDKVIAIKLLCAT